MTSAEFPAGLASSAARALFRLAPRLEPENRKVACELAARSEIVTQAGRRCPSEFLLAEGVRVDEAAWSFLAECHGQMEARA